MGNTEKACMHSHEDSWYSARGISENPPPALANKPKALNFAPKEEKSEDSLN